MNKQTIITILLSSLITIDGGQSYITRAWFVRMS